MFKITCPECRNEFTSSSVDKNGIDVVGCGEASVGPGIWVDITCPECGYEEDIQGGE